MAIYKEIQSHTRPSAATFAASQFFAAKMNSSEQWALCTVKGERCAGVIQNDPTSGLNAKVMVAGISKAEAGGTVTYFDPITVNSDSKFIKATDVDDHVLGYAMSACASGEIFSLLITHSGQLAELGGTLQQGLTASANYATTGQYTAVKIHSTAGQFVKCATAGEAAYGILQNAPASAAEGEIATAGICTAKAGTGGLAAGEACMVEVTTGKLIAVTTGYVVGYAVAAISADANGLVALVPNYAYSVAGMSLANTKFWIGSSGGVAAAFAMSGDATCTAGGVVSVVDMTFGSDARGDIAIRGAAAYDRLGKGTAGQILMMDSGPTDPEWASMSSDATIAAGGAITIEDDAVSAAKMGSTVAGSDGCIFKSTSTPNAVAELDVPIGNLIVGTTNDVTLLDMGASAGAIMVDNGTIPVSVAVSGAATLAADGTLTIAADYVAASMMASTVAGSDGAIFKSTSTPNAVAELDVPIGNLLVGVSGDVGLIDMGASAGNLLVDSGTAPASVAVSGDATLAAAGTLTIAKTFMRTSVVDPSVADTKAMNATPIVLVDFSAEVTAGRAASGDALIFHDCVIGISGGTINYDQNQNLAVKYQTAGGGATLSTTLANFIDASGPGSFSTCKQITTDVTPEIDEDLVMTASASPYNANGDRLVRYATYWSVFTPA